VKSSRDDVLDLFDHAWRRFRARMDGLGDGEWAWQPTPDERLTLHRRLRHIAELLREERNGPWLGLPAGSAPPAAEAADAADALLRAEEAYAAWRGRLAALPEEALAAPVGPAAGPYAASTRRSFALHIADELIHHTAEAALLRDLYAAAGPADAAQARTILP
jgi:hypothetical protein